MTKLNEAWGVVMDLAGQNIIDEDDEPEMNAAQNEAIETVGKFIAKAPELVDALRDLCDDLLIPAREWQARKDRARALLADLA